MDDIENTRKIRDLLRLSLFHKNQMIPRTEFVQSKQC
jgi:hypothetical protein